LFLTIPLWPPCTHPLMAASSRIMHQVLNSSLHFTSFRPASFLCLSKSRLQYVLNTARPIKFKDQHTQRHSCVFTGGFALQSYKGAQKPTPMEVMKAQATRLAEDPNFKPPPKMEIPTMEGKRQVTRPHKLKHRDMNVLTPSGFWGNSLHSPQLYT